MKTASTIPVTHSLAPVSRYHQDGYERRKRLRKAGYKLLSPCPAICRGFNDKTPVLCFDSPEQARRYVRHLTIAGKNESLWPHHGWYADPDYSETIKPAVAFIGKVGLYGYQETGGMLAFYMESGPHKAGSEAAFDDYRNDLVGWADTRAERAAENEMEYQAQWRKARDLEDEIETAKNERAGIFEEARGWIADLRDSMPGTALCARLKTMLARSRQKAARLAREIAEKQAELATLPA